MSIEKKSLISTLRTTKKANVAKEEFGNVAANATIKSPSRRSPAKFIPAKIAPAKIAPAKIAPAKVAPARLSLTKKF